MKDKPLDLTKPFKFRNCEECEEIVLLDTNMAPPCVLLFKWKNRHSQLWHATHRFPNGKVANGTDHNSDIINIPEEPKWREFRSVSEVIPLIGKYLIRDKNNPERIEALTFASPRGMPFPGFEIRTCHTYEYLFHRIEMSNDGGRSWMPFGVLE